MRHKFRPTLLAAAIAFAGSGCASLGIVTGQTKATEQAMQSETSATTSYAGKKHRVVVAFNDETANEGKVVPLKIRTGPQFSFDVGAASEGESDAIRFLYTRHDSTTQRHFVEGSACALDLSANGPKCPVAAAASRVIATA
jgi:hypothetical protein